MAEPSYSYLHDEFFREASLLFPSTSRALLNLRVLGQPPPESTVNISYPPPQIHTFLQIAASFSYHLYYGGDAGITILRQFNHHLETYIGPWLRCLLKSIVLSGNEPSTPEGRIIRERCLLVIPTLLAIPYSTVARQTTTPLRAAAPYLHDLFLLVSVKLFDTTGEPHRTWGRWCLATNAISGSVQSNQTTRGRFADHELGVIYSHKDNSALHSNFIRHFERTTRRIPRMTQEDFYEFYHFHVIFTLLLQSDIATPSIIVAWIQASTKLLSATLSKATVIRRNPTSDACEIGHHWAQQLAFLLSALLEKGLTSPEMVAQCLDSGIIFGILRIDAWVIMHDEEQETAMETCGYRLGLILERISLYLVYPAVLARFLKCLRK
ncbi:hypothetical protein V5O48_014661, partial [Marasmius crinis-equi]